MPHADQHVLLSSTRQCYAQSSPESPEPHTCSTITHSSLTPRSLKHTPSLNAPRFTTTKHRTYHIRGVKFPLNMQGNPSHCWKDNYFSYTFTCSQFSLQCWLPLLPLPSCPPQPTRNEMHQYFYYCFAMLYFLIVLCWIL